MRIPFKPFTRFFSLLVLSSVFLVSTGCGSYVSKFYFGDLFSSGSGTKTDKAAEQLINDGMEQLNKKNYGDAAKSFQQVKEKYPYSKFAILAELKLGDARFFKEDYTEAAVAYEEFARLHPRNEVVPYVVYQIGMSHFLQFTSTDRDPQETKAAIDAFQRVVRNFPQSEFAARAQKQIFECEKRIATHDYRVGMFYFRTKEYFSAKDRLDRIIKEYPAAVAELGYRDSIEKALIKCNIEVAKGPQKPDFWKRNGF